MTTGEFVITLEKFRDALPNVRNKLILDSVFTAVDKLEKRVIKRRENAEGLTFGNYSPAYLKKRIAAGKGADARINFSYTGKMWQSTQPFIVESSDEQVRVRVQPTDDQRREIMGIHDARFNKILRLNQEEINVVAEDFASGLADFVQESFK